MSFKICIEEYIRKTDLIIDRLNDKIVKEEKYKLGYIILKTIGASVASVGIIGIALAEFTAGMSLCLVTSAYIASVVGALTCFGTQIVHEIITKDLKKEIQDIANEHKLVGNQLNNHLNKIMKIVEEFSKRYLSTEVAILHVLIEIARNGHQLILIYKIKSVLKNYHKMKISFVNREGIHNSMSLSELDFKQIAKILIRFSPIELETIISSLGLNWAAFERSVGSGEGLETQYPALPVIRSLKRDLIESNIKVQRFLHVYKDIEYLSSTVTFQMSESEDDSEDESDGNCFFEY